jgi:23S rRNA (adenine2503-C2)-methyltransferase
MDITTTTPLSLPTDRPDIRSLDMPGLAQALSALGQPGFRAKQVHEWLWHHGVRSFDEMHNLPKALIAKLKEGFTYCQALPADVQKSKDRTLKSGFLLHDGNVVEGVLIPTAKRMTACVSSQVGCPLGCKFCATGYLGRRRNLEAGEIYDQVWNIARQAEENYGIPLSHIVFMGMGEPLLNYSNVMRAIEHITSPTGLGMSPRRITVSTAGIAKMIKRLADDEVKFHLALSLHAANDEKRNQIMPKNDSNNLEVLADALKYFYAATGTRITFEYIVFQDVNDSLQDARELAEFCKIVPCKINLIEYNPIDLANFKNTSAERLNDFANFLESKNLIVNIRRSRGKDIDAACGQLANKNSAASGVAA